ncbi:general substrate transporter [Aureobasidium pullulans]|nr:general substrate transporter [Aureobasidium pullulans]THX01473.1 general substrate transporter [Aureobasidium pullulans]
MKLPLLLLVHCLLLIGLFASLGSFLFGYDLGVIGGAVASDAFVNTFHNPAANEIGAVVSIFTGGAFFGALVAGMTTNRLGRRKTIILGALIFCIGGALQTAAQNLGYLYGGRCIAGLGVGILVMIIPLYQAEIAHPSIRGRLTGLQQLFIGLGATTAAYTTYGTTKNFAGTNNDQWRVPLGVQIIPAGILAALILLFPESPRWLMDHHQHDKALHTLAKLHAAGDVTDTWVVAEYEQIKAAIQDEEENGASSLAELFKDKACFRRLVLVAALQAGCQMTGVSAIQYFAPDIYKQVGVDTSQALLYQGISYIWGIAGQISTVLFIDRIGRRWPLILGNLACASSFIVTAAVIARFPHVGPSTQHSLLWLFLVFGWIFQFAFSMTCGSLTWVIPSEIFDTKTRAYGVSIGCLVSFAFNTMIGQITAPAIETSGWRYFLLFVICNITNAIFFWAFLPETKGVPLEEMNRLFRETGWFVPGQTRSYQTELAVTEAEIAEKGAMAQHREVA